MLSYSFLLYMGSGKPPKPQKVKQAKENTYKTQEERIDIVNEVIAKLQEVHLVGVDEDNDNKHYSGFEGVTEFLAILEEYKKPVILSGFTGVIKVPELKRNIEYILPLRRHIQHGARLVYA